MIKSVLILNGQSNFDICLKTYGGLDTYVKLLTDNSVLLSSEVSIGSIYKYDTNKIINKLITGINYNTKSVLNEGFFDPNFFDPGFFE